MPSDLPPAAPQGPVKNLADLSELLAREQPHMSRFVRGLTIGALVGAAIAGSAIWRRSRRRSSSDAAESESGTDQQSD